MTTFDEAYSLTVNQWIEQFGSSPSTDHLVTTFDQTIGAIWRRAQATLGAITLVAIGESVLYDSVSQHPCLKSLVIDVNGLSCTGLRLRAYEFTSSDLLSAMRCYLTEFMRVIGRSTGNVLAPKLLAELKKHLVTDVRP